MKRIAVMLLLAAAAGCAKEQSGAAASATASAAAANPASASDGAVVYVTNCSSCHQPDGKGVPGAFPPLAGNAVVTGNPLALIAIVKDGIGGKVLANGRLYSGIMPAWGGVLSDDEIAAAITYVRSSWHNRAPGVSAAQVAAVK